MHPTCVRISPGKEDGCDLKPFIVTQRVRHPPGRGGARQPEASLAWAAATPLVKRRQRVLKPCRKPRDHESVEAFAVLGAGAAPGRSSWSGLPVRPGSWSGAKVRDGSPGNLRGPADTRVETAGKGAPAQQGSRPGRRLGDDRERFGEHEKPGPCGSPRRRHKPKAECGGTS